MDYMVYIWLGLALFLAVLELSTAQLVSIWFIVGALAALICAATFLQANIIVQIVVFIVVSALALILTRPMVKKLKNFDKTHTNSDKHIGRIGIVVQDIDNLKASGMVEIDGSKWTARSTDGEIISAGSEIVVNEIKGVKLMVSKK